MKVATELEDLSVKVISKAESSFVYTVPYYFS